MKELKSIASWISKNYTSANKVVEVGVGNTTKVLSELRKKIPNCELIATDVREVDTPEGVNFMLDDVTDPDMNIYRGSYLIFSIRAPPELYSHLVNLARKIKTDLLVKPLSSEESPQWGELINYSGTTFYILKNFKE